MFRSRRLGFSSLPLWAPLWVLGLFATVVAAEAQAAPLSAAELDRLQQEVAVASSTAAQRLEVAQRIEQSVAQPDREGFRVYIDRLARPLVSSPPSIKRLIHAVWGQYPNPDYPRGPGKDPPMWLARPEPPPPPIPPGTPRSKRPKPQKPHDPEAADWLSGLAELDVAADPYLQDLPPEEVRAARAEMLIRVALLHALGTVGRQGERDAVYAVFQFAFAVDGLFRDECGRTLRSIGGHAVPSLIRIYHDRSRGNAKMRRYASYQLDRMDRLRPGKAISAAPDDVVRADILRAYGEVLALDAVEAVLEQVGATSHRVRREARWAWLRYVDGPEPPPAPKRKRKLPGGKEEAEEKEDYLNYREMAVLALARTYQELFSREPSAKLSPRQITDEIFAHYDRLREEKYAQVFESGQAHERAGELALAVADFGWILANQPDHPRRVEMAEAFRRYGEEQAARYDSRNEAEVLGQALGLLRQALLLDPSMKDAARVRARIHLLDGRQARSLGGDGTADFTAALEDNPALHSAPDLQRRNRSEQALSLQRSLWRLVPWLIVGLGLVLLGLAIAMKRLSRASVQPAAPAAPSPTA